ncbi:hypothetical protein NQ318_000630 [Aromia moschata]|uniref:Uncharacterized protein n=1 Tax=Aromia moschata TaxID=1265417 RepID=A0AAV8XAS8_9CUCU|nr:hypothetical protein NQ318_000630 [Aromia moschata]
MRTLSHTEFSLLFVVILLSFGLPKSFSHLYLEVFTKAMSRFCLIHGYILVCKVKQQILECERLRKVVELYRSDFFEILVICNPKLPFLVKDVLEVFDIANYNYPVDSTVLSLADMFKYDYFINKRNLIKNICSTDR